VVEYIREIGCIPLFIGLQSPLLSTLIRAFPDARPRMLPCGTSLPEDEDQVSQWQRRGLHRQGDCMSLRLCPADIEKAKTLAKEIE
jgi:hypothetical protein